MRDLVTGRVYVRAGLHLVSRAGKNVGSGQEQCKAWSCLTYLVPKVCGPTVRATVRRYGWTVPTVPGQSRHSSPSRPTAGQPRTGMSACAMLWYLLHVR